VKAIGSNVTGVQGDITKLTDLDRLYENRRDQEENRCRFRECPASPEFAPLGKITEGHFDRLFGITSEGTLFTVQKALPLLNDGGSIILNGLGASVKGTPAFGVYGATRLLSVLSSEPGPWISRTVIFVPTSLVQGRPIRRSSDGQPADAIARIVSTIPDGTDGDADEIGQKQRCFWHRMTPASSRVSNCSLMGAEASLIVSSVNATELLTGSGLPRRWMNARLSREVGYPLAVVRTEFRVCGRTPLVHELA